MFQIGIDTRWIFERMGISIDPEIVELGTLLSVRFKQAPDKKQFVKDALRKVLGDAANFVRKT